MTNPRMKPMTTEAKILRCAADLIELLNVKPNLAFCSIYYYGDVYTKAAVVSLTSKDYSDFALTLTSTDKRKIAGVCNRYFGEISWEWVNEWRMKFPAGVKSMGRLVRGDKRGTLVKMKKFWQDYPEFADQSLVNKATDKYLYEKKLEDWHATTCADYFINKYDASMLASYCELVLDSRDDPKQSEQECTI